MPPTKNPRQRESAATFGGEPGLPEPTSRRGWRATAAMVAVTGDGPTFSMITASAPSAIAHAAAVTYNSFRLSMRWMWRVGHGRQMGL